MREAEKNAEAAKELRQLKAAVRRMLKVRDKEADGERSTEDLLDAIAELEGAL